MGHVVVGTDGQSTEVAMEPWKWEADYVDGTILKQFGDDGVFHRIGEVGTGLSRFRMVGPNGEVHVVEMGPSWLPIHFYRNTRTNVGTIREAATRLYCFGYQTGGVRKVQAIFPDGHVEPIV